ncbi:MAG: DciA family protein, partial [Aestuariivirga sp.]
MDTLDKHFRELTRQAFARYGFSYAEVNARWPEIVGEALAQHARPERIKWPRGAGENAQKLGGTLVIAAAPGRALDLQYEVPR